MLHTLDGSAPAAMHQSFLEHVGRQDGQNFATADDEPNVNRTTWAVSLHPDETVFAACGAGGKVGIRSAVPIEGDDGDRFGKLVRELETGREKFGLTVKFVRSSAAGVRITSRNGASTDVTCELCPAEPRWPHRRARIRKRPGLHLRR